MKILFSYLVISIFASWFQQHLYADLVLFNRTTSNLSVAIAFETPLGWKSEGWIGAHPGERVILMQGNMKGTEVHYYAKSDAGEAWTGKMPLCVSANDFSIDNASNCESHGYQTKYFLSVVGEAYDLEVHLAHKQKNTDKYYRGMLLGSWEQSKTDVGVSVSWTWTYTNNGHFSVSGKVSNGYSSKPISMSGTWEISSGMLTCTISACNIPEVYPIGYSETSTISKIDFHTLTEYFNNGNYQKSYFKD